MPLEDVLYNDGDNQHLLVETEEAMSGPLGDVLADPGTDTGLLLLESAPSGGGVIVIDD